MTNQSREQIQRYKLDHSSSSVSLIASADGSFVTFADHSSLMAEKDAAIQQLGERVVEWQDAYKDQCKARQEGEGDLREANILIASLQQQIAEFEWEEITADCKPTGEDHLLYYENDGMDVYNIGYFNRLSKSWIIDGEASHDFGWTHFRPINPPQPKQHRRWPRRGGLN